MRNRINRADAKAVLAPRTIKILCENLDRALTDIELAVILLTQNIGSLLEKLGSEALPNPLFLVNLEKELGENLQLLSKGIDYLLNLVQQYPQPTSAQPSIAEELEHEQLHKWVNDIKYIRNYLVTQAHAQTIVSEFPGGNEPSLYFRRLSQYLDVLPRYCNCLGAISRQTIQDKVTGAKFATPALYKAFRQASRGR